MPEEKIPIHTDAHPKKDYSLLEEVHVNKQISFFFFFFKYK